MGTDLMPVARTKKPPWVAIGAVCILGDSGIAAGQCHYTVTTLQYPLGCPFGPVITVGLGLNEAGHVVGYYKCPAWDNTEAFWWTPESGFATLTRPPGVAAAQAVDVNNGGTICGEMEVAGVGRRGFVYERGIWVELPPAVPSVGARSSASAVSEGNIVVGERSVGQGLNPLNAFLWTIENGFVDLGVMAGGSSSATDNNNIGDVTGFTGGLGLGEAFLLTDGRLSLLGWGPGGVASHANAVNDSRMVAGIVVLPRNGPTGTSGQPALWHNDQWTLLGLLRGCTGGGARDISDTRQVIGACTTPDNVSRAFLWQHGRLTDLNELVNSASGIQLERAHAVNNSGQILCDGKDVSNQLVTFLLSPMDNPMGDLDFDCSVNVIDLLMLLATWGPCLECGSDLNDDGLVDVTDLVALLDNWG